MTNADAALDALRRWAATNRADLVAAAWHAGNRNITALARAAGCGRDAIYADLRAHGINPTSDRQEPPTVLDTDQFVTLPVPGWRHPHLLQVEKRKTSWSIEYRYSTKPFTGTEPRPEIPEEWRSVHPTEKGGDRDWELWSQRDEEIRLIQTEWAKAHFVHRIGEVLRSPFRYSSMTAEKQWTAYADARDKLVAAYAALDTTPDTMWRSALLAIIDLQEPARLAAANWDSVAHELAKLDQWLLREIGEQAHSDMHPAIRSAAAKHGIDVENWTISYVDDYEGGYGNHDTASGAIDKIIKTGGERIKKVKELAGEH